MGVMVSKNILKVSQPLFSLTILSKSSLDLTTLVSASGVSYTGFLD